jgi:hypothetical protein
MGDLYQESQGCSPGVRPILIPLEANGIVETLIHLTKRMDSGIEAVLAHPLKLFTILLNVGHLTTFLGPAWCGNVVCKDSYMMLST